MHVIAPERYQSPKKHHRRFTYLTAPISILIVAAAINYARPLPVATLDIHIATPHTTTPILSWPTAGQAAVAADGYGILGTYGDQTPIATASIAKVITALCVLQKAPLTLRQSGPLYTVSPGDVTLYQNYAAADGSLVPVRAGEKLTEYQALEALMLPSANNIADSLVRWVFGSQDAYAAYATNFLQAHDLNNTHVGTDASGFDPSTTSTTSDLAQLGLLVTHNPTLMQIVGEGETSLPVIGQVSNYDTVLGQSGITGIKTGNNSPDRGAFLFSASKQIGTQTLELTGAIADTPSLATALHESVQLASSLEEGFEQTTLTDTGQQVGVLHTAWGASSPIVSTHALQVVHWKATPITERSSMHINLHSDTIGTLQATAGPSTASTALHLARRIAGPSFWWRLTRH